MQGLFTVERTGGFGPFPCKCAGPSSIACAPLQLASVHVAHTQLAPSTYLSRSLLTLTLSAGAPPPTCTRCGRQHGGTPQGLQGWRAFA